MQYITNAGISHARYTIEMQSIGREKHTVLMVTPWPLTDCVHWHKMKINVSLYRKLLFLQLMWLKVQCFITLFISYNTRVAKRIYRRRNTKRGCYKKRGVLIHGDNRFCELPSIRSASLASKLAALVGRG